MKDYKCSCGYDFDKEDVKEWTNIGSGATCPKCWPNGFLNPKDKEDVLLREMFQNSPSFLNPDWPTYVFDKNGKHLTHEELKN